MAYSEPLAVNHLTQPAILGGLREAVEGDHAARAV